MTPRQADLIEYGFVSKVKPLRNRGVQFKFTKPLKDKTTAEYREKLQKKFIEALSKFNELDPMCGSGTTLKMCRETNRNAIGFEINPENEPIIRERLKVDTPSLETWASGQDVA